MGRRLMICFVLAWTIPLFAAGIRFVRVPQGGIQPQSVIDSRGIMHLIYFSGDPKQGDVFYVHSSDNGATFSTPLRVNSQPGSAIAFGTIRGAQIAVGRNGRVHVAWNGSGIALPEGVLNPEAGKPGSPMLYARLDDAGKAFEPQRNLMRHTFGLDGGGAVAADSSGNVYVAWHGKGEAAENGEAGRQVWIARSGDDGKTFAAEAPAWDKATGACGCCGMGIFASRNGTVYGLYRSATESVHRDIYLLLSTDRGKTFDGRMLHKWEINACPMSSMSFAESGNTVLGAWETGGQVYFSPLDLAAGSEPVAAPGSVKGRKHPRIAADNGQMMLVWTEGTGWKKGGSLAWQVYDRDGKPTGTLGSRAGVPAWSFGAVVPGADGGFVVLY
jgi:hypothetical protein